MALIVEDGSVVPYADSYISVDDAVAIAAKYGWDLPEDITALESALRNGAQYIMIHEPFLCGVRVSRKQTLSYPRRGVTVRGFSFPSTEIPTEVKQAQVAAAVDYGAGADVRASTDGRVTTLERVEGAVTVGYASNGATGASIMITKAVDALRPLMCGNNGTSFNVFRG